jgi:hypothetical protein
MVTSWLASGAGTGPAAAQACIPEPCSSRARPSGLAGAGNARKWVGVHGDVPLPRVDVGWPGGGNLGVGAGGCRRGQSGVAGVTTTTPTAASVLLVLSLLAGAVVAWRARRRCRRGGRRLGSRKRCAGVERRGISRWTRAVQVELLQDQVVSNLQEGRERRVAPYDGAEVLKTRVPPCS